MNKYLGILYIFILVLSCKHESKTKTLNTIYTKEEEISVLDSLIIKLTLDETYEITDVRRYGVFPNKNIGEHPKTGNNKIYELLNLAEQGAKLTFPQGIYKTGLNFSNRKNVELNFNKSSFTGAILINGTSENIIKNITLNGKLTTYSSLATSYADKIRIEQLFIKNNKNLNISGYNSSGCNIYTGTLSLFIDYLEIEGTGSDGEQYRYTPAALMIHGKSPPPNDILIKHVEIKSSDRHGAYLSGRFIEIEMLIIYSFAQGKIDNMISIANTVSGDEKKITGVWLNDFEDSKIENLYIDTSNSPGAYDAIFLDSGDQAFPSLIAKVELKGTNVKVRMSESTNLKILE